MRSGFFTTLMTAALILALPLGQLRSGGWGGGTAAVDECCVVIPAGASACAASPACADSACSPASGPTSGPTSMQGGEVEDAAQGSSCCHDGCTCACCMIHAAVVNAASPQQRLRCDLRAARGDRSRRASGAGSVFRPPRAL